MYQESFNFNSELKTHLIQHQCRAKHLCAFPNCGKIVLKTNQIYQDTPKNIHQKLSSVQIVRTVPKTNVILNRTDANIVE